MSAHNSFDQLTRSLSALLSIALIPLMILSGAVVNAQEDPPPSAAELEAQAHAESVRIEQIITLCRHTLLYGEAADKAELVAALNGKTCEEAAIETAAAQ